MILKWNQFIFEYAHVWEPSLVTPKLKSYKFKDDKGIEITVQFSYYKKGCYELSYYAMKDGVDHVSLLTNSDNPIKLYSTIIKEIIPTFIKDTIEVKEIKIIGVPKEREKDYVSQRTKIYLWQLKKNPILGWTLSSFGNTILLKKS